MNSTQEIKEFGIKRENEERRDGGCAIIFNPETQKYAVYDNLKTGILGLYGGGFDENEDEETGVLREVVEESGLYDFLHFEKIEKVAVHYYNSNKNVNRVAFATCFFAILKSADLKPTKLEEHEKFELVWKNPTEILSNWNSRNKNKDFDHWVYFMGIATNRIKELGYAN
ncbi:hypothetical protein A3C57_02955 [Candidatus Nomurabacteria bacterium RIFCSPHIGHO2_02_FULL_33_12]|uniref:Nudix hydrolase domain-containing protein n=1 Tax=Candidatus Nomurabacteria bacterium RIFCSPLOWO2_01_FULL_33_17 TaxID=1801764 RepID=A0A1F6WP42_9BACT|nr:MAG: hypothetical protein A3C57_02955 [Candidatus Nomurabacteria bacterium RIFCSPHIGHO2_02_FULL_33_12]OGI83604.1 MAG: hypothetical protein A2903_01705 [Candidatus Nomurabacteria bacterium RIFCSPLOWO2_01_FULL_33_17]